MAGDACIGPAFANYATMPINEDHFAFVAKHCALEQGVATEVAVGFFVLVDVDPMMAFWPFPGNSGLFTIALAVKQDVDLICHRFTLSPFG